MRLRSPLIGLTLLLTLLMLTTEDRLPQLLRLILGAIAIALGAAALFVEIKRARQS